MGRTVRSTFRGQRAEILLVSADRVSPFTLDLLWLIEFFLYLLYRIMENSVHYFVPYISSIDEAHVRCVFYLLPRLACVQNRESVVWGTAIVDLCV